MTCTALRLKFAAGLALACALLLGPARRSGTSTAVAVGLCCPKELSVAPLAAHGPLVGSGDMDGIESALLPNTINM